MPNFELWHSCRKWAMCSYLGFIDVFNRDIVFLPV
jgi:hypothetical protein